MDESIGDQDEQGRAVRTILRRRREVSNLKLAPPYLGVLAQKPVSPACDFLNSDTVLEVPTKACAVCDHTHRVGSWRKYSK